MRTNLIIDDALMAQAMEASGLTTKRETVELTLTTLVQLRRQEDIRAARGKLAWVGDLDPMRSDQ